VECGRAHPASRRATHLRLVRAGSSGDMYLGHWRYPASSSLPGRRNGILCRIVPIARASDGVRATILEEVIERRFDSIVQFLGIGGNLPPVRVLLVADFPNRFARM